MEDYIDHDHHLEERRELSHSRHPSTSSSDDDDEVTLRCKLHTELRVYAAP